MGEIMGVRVKKRNLAGISPETAIDLILQSYQGRSGKVGVSKRGEDCLSIQVGTGGGQVEYQFEGLPPKIVEEFSKIPF